MPDATAGASYSWIEALSSRSDSCSLSTLSNVSAMSVLRAQGARSTLSRTAFCSAVSSIPACRHVDTLSVLLSVYPHPIVARLRSEEHTSELQSREKLVCRLLLEKKNSNRVIRY